MSVFPSSGLRHTAPEAGEREASSSIITACRFLSHWQLVLGIVLVTLAGVVPWWMMEKSRQLHLFDELYRFGLQATGKSAPPSPNPGYVLDFGIACGVLAALNAAFIFRCRSGLRSFALSRRVHDLHPAVSRLRTMWRVFSISTLLVVGVLIYMSLMRMFVFIPAA